MFLFLLCNIVRDPQDTGRLSIDDDRRAVHGCVTNAAVSREVTQFKTLRLAMQRRGKVFPPHIAVLIVNMLEKVVADDFVQSIAGLVQHRLIAPLIIAFGIQRINRFASAFENVLQERLPLSRDRLDLAQF